MLLNNSSKPALKRLWRKKSLAQAKNTNDKWQQLFHQGVVSELGAENMATALATNQATADAFAANLRFLEQELAR